MPKRPIIIRVLFFPAPDLPNMWIAQGLELDIAAQGATIDQAKYAFEATIWGYLHVAASQRAGALDHVPAAPQVFWDMWEAVQEATIQAERLASIPAYLIPVVSHDTVPA